MDEDLMQTLKRLAYSHRRKIGVGYEAQNSALCEGVKKASVFADIIVVGDLDSDELNVVRSTEPEKVLVDMLVNHDVDAAVRGSLSANKVWPHLKSALHAQHLYRAALLTTHDNVPFFLAPVGIDEGEALGGRIELTMHVSRLLTNLGMKVKVGVLSGGRAEDAERSTVVARTLKEAEELTTSLTIAGINAVNYNILIEDAIKSANVIIAPNGICGNLIFRSLVLIGGGTGYGAPVLGIPYTFVDTSRSGTAFHDAIMLASALCK